MLTTGKSGIAMQATCKVLDAHASALDAIQNQALC